MRIFKWEINRIPKKAVDQNKHKEKKPLPISTGDAERSSVQKINGNFIASKQLEEIRPEFSLEWLSTLENLAAYNPDVGYALDNIVQLANTEHRITFPDDVPDEDQKAMKLWLNDHRNNWYDNSSGERTLKADLLTQIVINGALSAEMIPLSDLSDIKNVVRVAVKDIRFVYDREKDSFEPYQAVGTHNRGASTDKTLPGLIKLNPVTYKYIAWRRIFQSPYPTPPFLAAVEGLLIQQDMVKNFKNIMEKLGMLGFLSVKVAPPEQDPGENDEAYLKRCGRYLDEQVYPQIKNNLSSGMIAGFEGTHEFELQGNNMNVQGAQGLVEIIQLIIFAGLKQDPNMLGRNFSTTETFGRVIMSKLLSQISDYQSITDRFFEELYIMGLRLAGFSPGALKVVSESPMIGDRVKEETAEKLRIQNVRAKYDAGYISQQTAANELEYDEPDQEEPRVAAQNSNGVDPENDPKDPANEPEETKSNSALARMISYYMKKYRASVPVFQYSCPEGCGHHNHDEVDTFATSEERKFVNQTNTYYNATNTNYKKAVKNIVKKLGKKLLLLPASSSQQLVNDTVFACILQNWDSQFMSKQVPITKKHIENSYDSYRNDKAAFNASTGDRISFDGEIPDAIFSLDDFRAIQFMEDSDGLYLGKFITDDDTRKKVLQYISDNYLSGDLPIGNDVAALNQFKDEFGDVLELEAWKIRRIIDTTIQKVRNFSAINYYQQAEVDKYEIVEVIDDLTCEYCVHMDGKTFKVRAAKAHMNNQINANPEDLSTVSPFATAIKIKDFKQMNSSQLQGSGHLMPAFHPHCRGRTLAVV